VKDTSFGQGLGRSSFSSVESRRGRYAELALGYIPRLLHLVDRNPFSVTYGCFDRSYWHYRTMDFPCGMSQEFVLPLALVFARQYPGNPYRGVARVGEIAQAGVRFLLKASYRDGTTDDYFPFERAMGALVFSLYAAAESYQVLGMRDERVVNLFSRRLEHLSRENETGQLANHQALAALAAYSVFEITGDPKHRRLAEARAELTLSWQNTSEGWFQEYEGADPGYHTCTIDFLAKLWKKSGNNALLEPLTKAVEFAWNFMHPDGSYGGEYGSRNTYHFYPHGFELLARRTERAGQIADAFLEGSLRGKRYINDDDRMTAHYVYDFLQAYEDFCPDRPAPIQEARTEAYSRYFPGCRITVRNEPSSALYSVANLSKGGVVKVFDPAGPVASDTGLIGRLADGKVVVSHLVWQQAKIQVDDRRVQVTTPLSYRRTKLPTPWTNILFRMGMLTVGRFNANLVRRTLQKILITGKPTTAWEVTRTIEFAADEVTVEDRIPLSCPLIELAAGSDATSIYVANSNVFQESVLCPWHWCDVTRLPVENGARIWKRVYGRRHAENETESMSVVGEAAPIGSGA
jgi:hypothetical protein